MQRRGGGVAKKGVQKAMGHGRKGRDQVAWLCDYTHRQEWALKRDIYLWHRKQVKETTSVA